MLTLPFANFQSWRTLSVSVTDKQVFSKESLCLKIYFVSLAAIIGRVGIR